MIPRVQKAGGSFAGAGQYYLHDKAADRSMPNEQKPTTNERVLFTATRNCLAQDPERAFAEMRRTAEDQAWLKKEAGVATSGRVCENPVKTLSLSWHQEDQPTPEHILEAADAFVKHMGWNEHQAVYVAHRDTEHPHIHIILSRVHPETGRTLDDYREQVRAQNWALSYEREHGRIRCEAREANALARDERVLPERHREKTREAANEHLPHDVIMMTRPLEQEFTADEKARANTLARADLKQEQRAEREAFFKDGSNLFRETRHAVYDEVRKEYAPEWRQFYKDREHAECEAEAWSKHAMTRALYFAKEGRWNEAHEAFADRNSVRDAVTHDMAVRKADLKSRQMDDLRERQREACDALREARDAEYKNLLQRQRDERAALKAAHAQGLSADDLEAGLTPGNIANENASTLRTHQSAQDMTRAATSHEQEPERTARHQEEHAAKAPEPSRAPDDERLTGRRDATDLGSGAIGAVAGYIADQLMEAFAPTPPEEREAQALREAKREAEKEKREPTKEDIWARHVEAALRGLEEERAQKRAHDRDYWNERDRSKDWERDR